MPRPGPRPYECVRRAWHSDRHQPMRGSLIQELFRVANEAHSAATRKNREWQEKLPFVVFKAEEIMYSKANSEAEYMDLSTLWDRANLAVDTIIRKDDSSSSSDTAVPAAAADLLLQPCIEAALNLGCIPRRASRSQRHSNPGCYLTASAAAAKHGSSPAPLKIPDGSRPHLPGMGSSSPADSADLPSPASWYSAVLKSAAASNSAFNAAAAASSSEPAFVSCESPPLDGPAIPAETGNLPEFAAGPRTYPLCYFGGGKENSCFRVPPLQTPPDRKQQSIMGAAGTAFEGKSTTGSSNDAPIDVETFAPDNGCDLSLRLGLPSPAPAPAPAPTWSGAESSWTDEVEDVGSSSSCDGSSKFYDPSPCRARAVNIERSIAPAEDKCFEFF